MSKISRKKLERKAKVVLEKMYSVTKCNGMDDLQFESLDMDTKRDLYKAIDSMKTFIDNINP